MPHNFKFTISPNTKLILIRPYEMRNEAIKMGTILQTKKGEVVRKFGWAQIKFWRIFKNLRKFRLGQGLFRVNIRMEVWKWKIRLWRRFCLWHWIWWWIILGILSFRKFWNQDQKIINLWFLRKWLEALRRFPVILMVVEWCKKSLMFFLKKRKRFHQKNYQSWSRNLSPKF